MRQLMRELAGRDLGQSCQLAFLGIWHERAVSACTVIGLAAMLTPLLLLFGLRLGVVEGLRAKLEADPRTRELIPLRHGNYDAAWITHVADLPQTGFVLGNTRFLAGEVDLSAGERGPITATIVPTSANDPMVSTGAAIEADPGVAAITEGLAQKLAATRGSTVLATVSRRGEGGELEASALPLRVAEILPAARQEMDALYIAPRLLQSIERYRDRNAPDLLTPLDAPKPFATFRLFAKTIGLVAALRDQLAALGVDTRTQVATIELVLGLSRSVTTLFTVIAGVACGGYFVVLAMSLWAAAERHVGDFATLRLLGFGSAAIVAFSAIQAVLLGVLGGLSGIAAFLIARPIVNSLFAGQALPGRSACEVEPRYLVASLLGTVALAMVASCFATVRVARVTPADALRRV